MQFSWVPFSEHILLSSFLFSYALCSPTVSYSKAHDNIFLLTNVRQKNVKVPVSDKSCDD